MIYEATDVQNPKDYFISLISSQTLDFIETL